MNNEQGMLEGFEAPQSVNGAIAQVIVDVALPHVDHPLDYVIPDQYTPSELDGRLVRVRFAGQRIDGWVVSHSYGPIHSRMGAIESVVSEVELAPTRILEAAERIAKRFLANTSQILTLAIPPRHARAERAVLAQDVQPWPPLLSCADNAWENYPAGEAFLTHLRNKKAPRAAWTMLEPSFISCIAQAVQATASAGRSSLIVAPTFLDAQRLSKELETQLGVPVPMTAAEISAEERYTIYLRALRAEIPVIVGTRSAIWVPSANLGLIVIVGDGDDHLREKRFPRCDVLDVALQRSAVEGIALLVGGISRSVKAQALVRAGWAASLDPYPAALRAATPRVRVYGDSDAQREGAGGYLRIPSTALQVIRSGLSQGPVLIQVASSGYIPVLVCQRCATQARCPSCHGPLGANARGEWECGWCARAPQTWRCSVCSGTHLRAQRVGASRTAEEIARNLPEVSVLESTAAHRISRELPGRASVIVATAGAQPRVEGGYASAVVLDAQAVAGRPELWAPEEAVRRWMSAFSLVRPGGSALVVGRIPEDMSQCLVRWSPVAYADRLLDEREALGFFPATTIVALDGQAAHVRQVSDQLVSHGTAELVGTVIREARREGEAHEVRTLMRASLAASPDMLAELADIRRSRSARKSAIVAMSVNPPELF